MTELEVHQIGQLLLGRFPHSVQMALVDDPEFRTELRLKVGSTLSLDGGVVIFDRDAFVAANTALYAGSGRGVEVLDTTGGAWRLTAEEADGRTILRLSDGAQEFRVTETPGLKPTPKARLKDLDAALAAAGLPPTALPTWSEALASHVLDGDEIQALEESLTNTVAHAVGRIRAALNSSISLEALVPEAPEYWERLCGVGAPADLPSLAAQVTAHASELVRSNGLEGGRLALALAGHGTLLDASVFEPLADEALIELADWAVDTPDLVAKLAAFEVGLGLLERTPALGAPLERLVEQLLQLSSGDKAGRLRLFSTLFILVDGQLSHLRIAKDWAPLRRRHAAIAQASLIARHWPPSFDPTGFVDWAMEARGGPFYLQTLVDLQREPRWRPDYASPVQWKNEIMGRLHIAGQRHAHVVKATPLAGKLLGTGERSVLSQIDFPGAFLPGPLEGSSASAPELPPEFEPVIEANLAVERLEQKSLTALINMCGLFIIGDDKIARATKLIEDAGHRLPSDAKAEDADALLMGLASLAAISRSAPLAEELRILARRRRVEGQPMTALQEVALALTAAAAHEDRRGWAMAVGDWLGEVAFTTSDRDAATSMLDALERLCLVSPFLRGGLSRSIVALQSYLAV